MESKKRSNPSPAQLKQGPYALITELVHEQILFFVKENIKKTNPFVIGYWLINIVIFARIGYMLVMPATLSIIAKLSCFFAGMFVFLLLLLPVHELIHGAVYKLQGAKHVIIEAQWRKMVFLALADMFVVNARQFYLVALAPFVLITTLLLLIVAQAGEMLQWLSYGALLFHTSGCIGDFALCSYMYENRHLELYTYDDYQAKKSYFYSKTNNYRKY